jgi:hypothetical protein
MSPEEFADHAANQSGEDGAGIGACRVLCKNSNDTAAQRLRDDGFVASSRMMKAHFS